MVEELFRKFCANMARNAMQIQCQTIPVKPSKKKKHVSRPDFYKKREGASGRAYFLLLIISYCMLSLHIITFPQELLGQIIAKRNIRY